MSGRKPGTARKVVAQHGQRVQAPKNLVVDPHDRHAENAGGNRPGGIGFELGFHLFAARVLRRRQLRAQSRQARCVCGILTAKPNMAKNGLAHIAVDLPLLAAGQCQPQQRQRIEWVRRYLYFR